MGGDRHEPDTRRDGANTSSRAEAVGALRERILARFEVWLDAALNEEAPPTGLAAEILSELAEDEPSAAPSARREVDLYTLWSSLTVLSQEIRLQGRSFKQLRDDLSPWSERAGEVLEAHTETLAAVERLVRQVDTERDARQAEAARQVKQRARREQLEQLVDMRDRLLRGIESAREHQGAARERLAGGLFGRLRRRRAADEKLLAAVEAIENGCALTLARLDEVLDRSGVQEMECCGRPFDPTRMNAVDLLGTSAHTAGTVVEVYRRGYEWNGEVFRAAEVQVAQAPRGLPGE